MSEIGFLEVGAEFASGARLAGMIAGDGDAAAELAAPALSNPPTSSPCQQWREMGIAERDCNAASVSTPDEANASCAME